jgi:hypothetical protein
MLTHRRAVSRRGATPRQGGPACGRRGGRRVSTCGVGDWARVVQRSCRTLHTWIAAPMLGRSNTRLGSIQIYADRGLRLTLGGSDDAQPRLAPSLPRAPRMHRPTAAAPTPTPGRRTAAASGANGAGGGASGEPRKRRGQRWRRGSRSSSCQRVPKSQPSILTPCIAGCTNARTHARTHARARTREHEHARTHARTHTHTNTHTQTHTHARTTHTHMQARARFCMSTRNRAQHEPACVPQNPLAAGGVAVPLLLVTLSVVSFS